MEPKIARKKKVKEIVVLAIYWQRISTQSFTIPKEAQQHYNAMVNDKKVRRVWMFNPIHMHDAEQARQAAFSGLLGGRRAK